MKAYTLKKRKDTQELHLFEGDMKPEGGCMSSKTSICGGMEYSEGEKQNLFQCKSEDQIRIECAAIGRAVCGTCVSHLYASY